MIRLDMRLLCSARLRPGAALLQVSPRALTGAGLVALVDATERQWNQQGLGQGA